jgi:hypothetical protein
MERWRSHPFRPSETETHQRSSYMSFRLSGSIAPGLQPLGELRGTPLLVCHGAFGGDFNVGARISQPPRNSL